ncbi:STAS domain-containing protein [Polymorphospora lycopeni]|uniref:STAS domain-containing protein n=1 Tax=Polymorphospora lycopeni TaxID=3140240 RepID=A0ABV5CME5_9ACTN
MSDMRNPGQVSGPSEDGYHSPMAPDTLTVEVVRRPPRSARLSLSGDLDYDSADHLLRVAGQVVRDGCRDLVVDLSTLGICDSSGLGALIEVSHLCRTADGRMRLAGAGPHLRQLLARTGLDEVFEIQARTGLGPSTSAPTGLDASSGSPASGA